MVYSAQTWTDGPGGGTPLSAARLGVIESGIVDASASAGAYRAFTTTGTIATTDHVAHATSGTFTLTLPTAVGIAGRQFVIRNSGTGTITLGRTSSQTIDGVAANLVIAGKGFVEVVSDGAGWQVLRGTYTDESVGRRIFTWDSVNGRWQMTYGDTGWRSVSALLEVGATAGDWLMRRLNNKVAHMVWNATNTSGAIYVAPVGFRAKTGTDGMAVAVSKGDGTVGGAILNTPSTGAIWFAPVGMKAYAGAYYNFEYTTDNAWPASLPGTASGSIPA